MVTPTDDKKRKKPLTAMQRAIAKKHGEAALMPEGAPSAHERAIRNPNTILNRVQIGLRPKQDTPVIAGTPAKDVVAPIQRNPIVTAAKTAQQGPPPPPDRAQEIADTFNENPTPGATEEAEVLRAFGGGTGVVEGQAKNSMEIMRNLGERRRARGGAQRYRIDDQGRVIEASAGYASSASTPNRIQEANAQTGTNPYFNPPVATQAPERVRYLDSPVNFGRGNTNTRSLRGGAARGYTSRMDQVLANNKVRYADRHARQEQNRFNRLMQDTSGGAPGIANRQNIQREYDSIRDAASARYTADTNAAARNYATEAGMRNQDVRTGALMRGQDMSSASYSENVAAQLESAGIRSAADWNKALMDRGFEHTDNLIDGLAMTTDDDGNQVPDSQMKALMLNALGGNPDRIPAAQRSNAILDAKGNASFLQNINSKYQGTGIAFSDLNQIFSVSEDGKAYIDDVNLKDMLKGKATVRDFVRDLVEWIPFVEDRDMIRTANGYEFSDETLKRAGINPRLYSQIFKEQR